LEAESNVFNMLIELPPCDVIGFRTSESPTYWMLLAPDVNILAPPAVVPMFIAFSTFFYYWRYSSSAGLRFGFIVIYS